MTSRNDVNDFLERFKSKISEVGLRVATTSKNEAELSITGIMPHERTQAILKLEVSNYSDGPLKDHDGSSGEIWIFGSIENNMTIYIKLKLDDKAKCLSFHVANEPMQFPFK